MSNLTLREGTEDDAPIISKLIYETEDEPERVWGEGSKEEVLNRIVGLIKINSSRYSYKNIKVAEIDGKACGAIILLRSEEILKLDLKTSLKLLLSIKGVLRKAKYIRDIILSSSLKEGEFGDLYIANLATAKEVRGKGIGQALLKLAEKIAKEEGYKRCSLLAKDKTLVSYYGKLNYSFEKEEKYFDHSLYKMIKVV